MKILGTRTLLADEMVRSVALDNIPEGVQNILLQASGGNIRFTGDGSEVSASNGIIIYENQPPIEIPAGASLIRFLADSGSPTLVYQFVGAETEALQCTRTACTVHYSPDYGEANARAILNTSSRNLESDSGSHFAIMQDYQQKETETQEKELIKDQGCGICSVCLRNQTAYNLAYAALITLNELSTNVDLWLTELDTIDNTLSDAVEAENWCYVKWTWLNHEYGGRKGYIPVRNDFLQKVSDYVTADELGTWAAEISYIHECPYADEVP